MKVDAAVKKTTMQIAAGVLIGTGLMMAVFAVLGKLDYTVVLGGLLGAFASVGNFFLMCMAVQHAAEESAKNAPPESEESEETNDPETGVESSTGMNKTPLTDEGKRMKKRIQASYSLRMGLLILLSLLAALLPCFNVIAYAIPLILPRIVIMFLGFKKQ